MTDRHAPMPKTDRRTGRFSWPLIAAGLLASVLAGCGPEGPVATHQSQSGQPASNAVADAQGNVVAEATATAPEDWSASGAYLAGSRWGAGTKKLAPRISPGKTWVGVYGAIAASALAAVIGAWVLDARGAVLLGVVVLAMLTVAFSIVGDLFESLIKRHANAKDSGDLFPGHGGMFDRLDSVFAALPVWACGLALLGL